MYAIYQSRSTQTEHEFLDRRLSPVRTLPYPIARAKEPHRDGADDALLLAGRRARRDDAAYYRRRAEDEVGLILSEGTVIDRPASRNEPGIPFFHGEAALAGWQRRDRGGACGRRQDGAADLARRLGAPVRAAGQPDAPVESPSGLLAPRQTTRRRDERRGHRRHHRRLRPRAAEARRDRLRHGRDPRRAWLSDRPVLLGRHQQARRPLSAARR